MMMSAVAGRRRAIEMIDTVSTIVEVFVAALSLGALVMLVHAQRQKFERLERQPVRVSVERDSREL